ncbi:MAG: hypothetical protein RLZZ224_135 [Verrucomicrobiota bacterium]|jgi:tetratricopeptide (TPR) repeat protein
MNPSNLFLSLERAAREIPPSAIGESMNCFYDAMESDDEDDMYELLQRAVAIDPGNADAWLELMSFMPKLTTERHLEVLKNIVDRAAERLGKKMFQDGAGHFWGIHETRPYMRARAAYANALYQAGRLAESCAEVDAMLQLNPNDNQGLRYRQISVALALGQLDKVRMFLERYENEIRYNTVFAWAKVLERYLSGAMDEAIAQIKVAQQQNAHSLAYLLGERKIPKNQPDRYSLGSKEEAICFAENLQTAWNAHLAAKMWLKTQKEQSRSS